MTTFIYIIFFTTNGAHFAIESINLSITLIKMQTLWTVVIFCTIDCTCTNVFLYFTGPDVGMKTNMTAPALNVPDETPTSVIIGGAAAGAVVAIVVVVIAVVLYRKRKSSSKSDSSGETYMYSPSNDSVYTEPDYMVSTGDYFYKIISSNYRQIWLLDKRMCRVVSGIVELSMNKMA